jgi:uncharacterized protein
MIFDLSSFLGKHEHSYHLEGEIEGKSLSNDISIKIINPIKFDGDIFKVNGDYHIHVNIWYTYESNCDRCLKPTAKEIKTVLSGKLKESTGDFNDEDEDEEIIYYDTNNLLKLDDYIWSQVVSSLPMKVLCSTDCKGLCTQCGIDLNVQSCNCIEDTIDPRLEKLKELFPKK